MPEYQIPTTPIALPVNTSTLALDGSTKAFAGLFLAPKTGTITQIWLRCSAVTSSPVYRAGLESVVATKSPSGTYLSSGNAYVDFTPTAASAWRTLGTSVSVTQGDALAATVRYQSGTIGASNFATFLANFGGTSFNSPHSSYTSNTAGSWVPSTSNWPNIALQYDDGTIFGFSVDSVANLSWSSSGSPLVRGNVFVPSVNCYLSAVVGICRLQTSNASARIAIYDGTTELESVTHTFDAVSNSSNPGLFYWPVRRLLTAGSSYRVTIEPTTTAAVSALYDTTFSSSELKSTIGMGQLTKTTANTRGGSWTDTANTVSSIWPVIGSVDVGGSSRPFFPFNQSVIG